VPAPDRSAAAREKSAYFEETLSAGVDVDVKYINPFLESIDNVFAMMLDLQPHRKDIQVSDGNTGGDAALTSLVGISGKLNGVVVMRFPTETALGLAGRMLDAAPSEIDHSVIDAISEIVNMVAGSAKSKFNSDPPLELGLPTVVEGREYKVRYPTKSVWLEVPFDSDAGEFSVEVTFAANGGTDL